MRFPTNLILLICSGAICTAASAAKGGPPIEVMLDQSSPTTRVNVAIFPVQAALLAQRIPNTDLVFFRIIFSVLSI
jgi:hypothetical protein